MNKKILLLVCIFVLCINIVFAEPFRQGEVIVIKEPCYNGNNVCSSSASCNISIDYPNGTTFVSNQSMTNNYPNPRFNYTFSNSQITGTYSASVVCYDSGDFGNSNFDFIINETANDNGGSVLGLYIFLMSYIVLLFFLSGTYKLFKYEDNNEVTRILFFWVGLIHIIALIFVAWFDFSGYNGILSTIITLITINGAVIIYFIYMFLLEKIQDPVEKAIELNFKNDK